MAGGRGSFPGLAAGLLPRSLAIAGTGLVLAAMAGCQGQPTPPTVPATPLPEPHLEVSTVIVSIAEGINDGWPVRVELVRVETVEEMDKLLEIDTEGWFGEAGANFRLRNADAHVDAWEVAPGTSAGPFDVKRRGEFGGVLFCTAGDTAPVRFEQGGDAIVIVDEEGCIATGECQPVSAVSRLLGVPLPADACSKRVSPVWTRTITLVADARVNNDWPVRVDMVRVAHESDLSDLLQVTPREWFESESERFRRTHPAALHETWEVVPGAEVGPLDVRVRGRPLAGVLFCATPEATEPVALVEGDMVVSVQDTGCVGGAGTQSSPLDVLGRFWLGLQDFVDRVRRGWPRWSDPDG